ncbi:Imm1 family immunity protein [Actinosynnema sp. NPDC050436]|uniref:Imm1 family immunity protein n=1 Tax=Actinosynnema sp. NPDC050436 TaxID=3155659 RepID=UPI0034113B49
MALTLNVVVHGVYRYAETWEEMSALIAEVMDNLKSEEVGGPGISPGEQACFMFADGRHTVNSCDRWPGNYLYVAVNRSTGFGGLTWFVNTERAARENDGISEYIWVSDNPSPPDRDPRVVSDPGCPLFYDRRSAVPIERVRVVLNNFCRVGTGARPVGVDWVHGEMNGRRLDG